MLLKVKRSRLEKLWFAGLAPGASDFKAMKFKLPGI